MILKPPSKISDLSLKEGVHYDKLLFLEPVADSKRWV
jgi:hypothetical protein